MRSCLRVVARVAWSFALGLPALAVAADEKPKPAPLGVGQLVVRDAQSGSLRRLSVARYHVHVALHPPVALVQIDQAFYNPYDRQEEGTFVFNLPRGASVSRFAMYVTPSSLIEGELIERQKASQVYQTIVNQRRDPAILEQIGDNLFKIRVFPIFAHDTKRILLDFTLPLAPQGDEYRFNLPLLGDAQPIADFRLYGAISGATLAQSLQSPSHPAIAFKPQSDGGASFDWRQVNYASDKDFSLIFRQRPQTEPRTYLAEPLPGQTEPATYFAVELAADGPADKRPKPEPADVLILVDTSDRQRGAKPSQQVRQAIEALGPDDRFQVVCVDVAARPLTGKWQTPDKDTAAATVAKLDEQLPLGETNLEASVREALQAFEGQRPSRRRLAVYVGDGEDTLAGATPQSAAERIAPLLRQAQAAWIGVATRRTQDGQANLVELARRAGGLLFNLAAEPAAENDWRGWLRAGLPSPEPVEAVRVEGAAADDLFYPAALLPGEPLRIIGRTKRTEEIAVEARVCRGGQPVVLARSWRVNRQRDDVFLGRLWAQRKLEQLQRQEAAAPAQGRLRDYLKERIVALSREWSVLSQFTAFLVLESEEDYGRWNIVRSDRRRYWRPPDREPQPRLSADWLARVQKQAAETKPAVDPDAWRAQLAEARQALAAGDAALAQLRLRALTNEPAAQKSPEYQQLSRQSLAMLRVETALGVPGPLRSLYGPGRSIAFEAAADAAALVGPGWRFTPAFLERHPHARQLLQPVRADWAPATLDKLVEELAEMTGVNVIVDRIALSDSRISGDTPIKCLGWGSLSLRSYLGRVLKDHDLAMVDEPYRILITTRQEAESKLTTAVYPVSDLLDSRRAPPFDDLFAPYLDRELSAEKRLKQKLRRPAAANYVKTPLQDVIGVFAAGLGDTVVVDRKALDDVGIGLDTPVTAVWRDVPTGESLRWMLKPLGLDYMIADEALVITTPEELDSRSVTRLHSARGLVTASPTVAPLGGSQGMFGGMGGFGGAMGGFGGGMGGGAMGGFGGMGGQTPVVPVFPGRVSNDAWLGIEPDQIELDVPESQGHPPETNLTSFVNQAPAGVAGQVSYDWDSIVDLITSSVSPATWDDVGGPGSVSFFEPTLDLVFSQTPKVHDEVQQLLDKLRRLPQDPGTESRSALAAQGFSLTSPDEVLHLVRSTVATTRWDDVGGPGSCQLYPSPSAMVVSQTQAVHTEVQHLLTMLRRSRYEQLHGGQPWQSGGGGTSPLFARLAEASAVAAEPAEQEKPADGQLALARRIASGERGSAWRVSDAEGRTTTLAVARDGARIEVALPDCTLWADGPTAAAVYRGLRLVERGAWGHGVRRLADELLPWLPHATPEEVCLAFELSERDGKLRLRPRRLPAECGTHLEVLAADGPATVTWDCYRGGKLVARLRQSDFDGAQPPRPRTVTLEDAQRRTLLRWRREEQPPRQPPAALAVEGCLELPRGDAAKGDPLARGLAAMQRGEWAAADAALAEGLTRSPDQPLLWLLRAWCHEQDRRVGSRDALMAGLGHVGASGAGLAQFLADGHLTWLKPEEVYRLLLKRPAPDRTAADWDRLAKAAEAFDRPAAAEYAAAALKHDAGERAFERMMTLVRLLLEQERFAEAETRVAEWRKQPQPAGRLAAMAALLGSRGRTAAADALFAAALADKALPPAARADILRQQADVHEGLPRWKRLLAAADLLPAEDSARKHIIKMLQNELTALSHAADAAALAAATSDRALAATLRLKQAELCDDPAVAGELLWKLQQDGQLPPERRGWAMRTWNAAGQHDRTTGIAEAALRKAALPVEELEALERAYRASGRRGDAERAAATLQLQRAAAQPPTPPRGGGFF